MILSFSGIIISAILKSHIMLYICLVVFIAGVIMLIHWNTLTYNWHCSKCGNIRELNMRQYIMGMNIGFNEKHLFCPVCKKKVRFRGINKAEL